MSFPRGREVELADSQIIRKESLGTHALPWRVMEGSMVIVQTVGAAVEAHGSIIHLTA
jgi:hypothetical protein